MGAKVTSYALIGSKLEKEQLFVTKTVKIGKHNFTEDIKFHPQTGKPLWTKDEVPIPELNNNDDILSHWNGLKIIEARGYEGEYLGYYFYKDAFLKCSDSFDEVLHKQLTNNISELEKEICNKLAKIGLSVEASKTFGLHLLHLWG